MIAFPNVVTRAGSARLPFAALVAMTALLPAPGQAQAPQLPALVPVDAAGPAPGAPLAARAGSPELFRPAARPLEVTTDAPPVVQAARSRDQRGVPLMIIGGAAFVAGAIVGGDAGTILVLGGVGVGAWGAYVYFSG